MLLGVDGVLAPLFDDDVVAAVAAAGAAGVEPAVSFVSFLGPDVAVEDSPAGGLSLSE